MIRRKHLSCLKEHPFFISISQLARYQQQLYWFLVRKQKNVLSSLMKLCSETFKLIEKILFSYLI